MEGLCWVSNGEFWRFLPPMAGFCWVSNCTIWRFLSPEEGFSLGIRDGVIMSTGIRRAAALVRLLCMGCALIATAIHGRLVIADETLLPVDLGDASNVFTPAPATDDACMQALRCCCCPSWTKYAIFDVLFLQACPNAGDQPLVFDDTGAPLMTTKNLTPAVAPGVRDVGIEPHPGLLRRQVDARLRNPIQPAEGLLDAADARGARHPFYRDLDLAPHHRLLLLRFLHTIPLYPMFRDR